MTNANKLNLQECLPEIKKAFEEGKFIGTRQYFNDDWSPACPVGHAMAISGIAFDPNWNRIPIAMLAISTIDIPKSELDLWVILQRIHDSFSLDYMRDAVYPIMRRVGFKPTARKPEKVFEQYLKWLEKYYEDRSKSGTLVAGS